jgi:hypothetical protein
MHTSEPNEDDTNVSKVSGKDLLTERRVGRIKVMSISMKIPNRSCGNGSWFRNKERTTNISGKRSFREISVN